MSSETLINTACNPTPLLPGSGLETKLQLHHNGVMTYSHYVNGSIFSVPKFEVVAKNNHNSTGFDVMGHPVKASDHLVETVYGLVKFFLGWDYYSITWKLSTWKVVISNIECFVHMMRPYYTSITKKWCQLVRVLLWELHVIAERKKIHNVKHVFLINAVI